VKQSKLNWVSIFLTEDHTELDDITMQRENIFVEISNSRWTSNFLIAPNAKIDGGLLVVTLVRKLSRRCLLQCFPRIFTSEHITGPELEQFKTRHIRVQPAEPKILTPYGEIMSPTAVEMECIPQALGVF
jgi:diacylglycerol kinase (ATP)